MPDEHRQSARPNASGGRVGIDRAHGPGAAAADFERERLQSAGPSQHVHVSDEVRPMDKNSDTQTFTLDYGQMNQLLDLLNPLFHDGSGKEIGDAGKWERLRSFRNQLHRYLD
jgi:hypothetical protein